MFMWKNGSWTQSYMSTFSGAAHESFPALNQVLIELLLFLGFLPLIKCKMLHSSVLFDSVSLLNIDMLASVHTCRQPPALPVAKYCNLNFLLFIV